MTQPSRILVGSNGLPLGGQAPIIKPGESLINFAFALGPIGPVLILTIDGKPLSVPMPPDIARTVGLNLIGLAAQHDLVARMQATAQASFDAEAPPIDHQYDDLLQESIERTDGSRHDDPGSAPADRPDAGAIRIAEVAGAP